ncbi:hypothetical protein D3C72_2307380 [compost metagenome]
MLLKDVFAHLLKNLVPLRSHAHETRYCSRLKLQIPFAYHLVYLEYRQNNLFLIFGVDFLFLNVVDFGVQKPPSQHVKYFYQNDKTIDLGLSIQFLSP